MVLVLLVLLRTQRRALPLVVTCVQPAASVISRRFWEVAWEDFLRELWGIFLGGLDWIGLDWFGLEGVGVVLGWRPDA